MEAKQLKLTFLLAVLMSMVGAKAFAHDFAVKNADGVTIYYGLINNSTEVEVSHWGSSSSSYSGVVNIPESVTYGGKTYPVTSIGDYAFYNCGGLTSVTIPNSVTSIGSHAFYYCSGLTSVTIPNSVTSIGSHAFSYCRGLTSVTIGNSVASIGSSAFSYCNGLTEINVDENNSTYSSIDGVVFNKSQTELVCYPYGKQGAYVIPNSVTSIGDSAFWACSGLTSVTIPNSVTSIGNRAFSSCRGLTSIDIPNSVTSIGDYAFYYCRGLTSVTIGNSVTSIGYQAFCDCSGLTSVTIGNSVTSIGNWAFSGCSGLTSVTIPNSVTSIGESAFSSCTGLTSVTIGNSVTSIGKSAFFGCSRLTEINVDENNSTYSSIDGVVFNKSQTELVLCPTGKQGAYTIPNSVKIIGEMAFSGCSGLTSVTIPDSVTGIRDWAFANCKNLTSITIPYSVRSIFTRAFSNNSYLMKINVDESNTRYSSIDGVLFNKSQTNLIKCPEGRQGGYTIPNSVINIEFEAFFRCMKLTSVTIPNSVTSIGGYAFRGCHGLTSVTIPNSVTKIGYFAFGDCDGLTSVTIPNSVTSIGGVAFYGCDGLAEIYCHIEEPLILNDTNSNSTFSNTNTCTLHVPIGSKVKYQAADVWKEFLNIVEDLPTGIVSIDNSQSTIDNDVWFTLNGVRLNGKPTKAGVYIVNGRAVVIK